jgi:hypothetical protein
MDDPCIPKNVMVCCRGKKSCGRPTGRLQDAVWRYAEDFLHTFNWNAAARKTADRRIKIWESMVRTQDNDDDGDDDNIMSKKEGGGGKKSCQYLLRNDNTRFINGY